MEKIKFLLGPSHNFSVSGLDFAVLYTDVFPTY